MRYFVEVGGETLELDVERSADGGYSVRGADGREACVTALARVGTTHSLSVAGHMLEVDASDGTVKHGGERFSAQSESERERALSRARPAATGSRNAKEIRAPMPGRIVRVTCAPGDAVSKGAPLVVIEAMKMQNELCANADHVVRAVRVGSGDTVDRGAILLEFE